MLDVSKLVRQMPRLRVVRRGWCATASQKQCLSRTHTACLPASSGTLSIMGTRRVHPLTVWGCRGEQLGRTAAIYAAAGDLAKFVQPK